MDTSDSYSELSEGDDSSRLNSTNSSISSLSSVSSPNSSSSSSDSDTQIQPINITDSNRIDQLFNRVFSGYDTSSSEESFNTDIGDNNEFGSENNSGSGSDIASHMSQNSASDSEASSGTIAYELPDEMNQQNPIQNQQHLGEDDEDVIFIPREIETIDLCTQAIPQNPPRTPIRNQNQINIRANNSSDVIVIGDSPAVNVQRNHLRHRTAPYRRTSPRQEALIALNLSLNNSNNNLNDTQPKVTLQCPICYESAIKAEPMSTKCGHIFCKSCLMTCLTREKKCPVCKAKLSDRRGTTDYHRIYI